MRELTFAKRLYEYFASDKVVQNKFVYFGAEQSPGRTSLQVSGFPGSDVWSFNLTQYIY